MTRIFAFPLLLSLASSLLPNAASAQSREAAIERCRQTVGRAIVQSCMRSRGATADSQQDLAACRSKATPKVRSCVMAAMGGKGGGQMKAGANSPGNSAQNNLPVGYLSDIPAEFPADGALNVGDATGATIQIALSLEQTLAVPEGRQFYSRTETNLRVKLTSDDTLQMTRTRVAFDFSGKQVAAEPELSRSFKLGEAVDIPGGKAMWTVERGRLVSVFTVDGAAGRTIIDFPASKEDPHCKVYFGYSREDGSDRIFIRSLTGAKLEVLNAKMATSDCRIER